MKDIYSMEYTRWSVLGGVYSVECSMRAPFLPSSMCPSFPYGTSYTSIICGEPSVLLRHTSRIACLQSPGPSARKEISLIRFCPFASGPPKSSGPFVALCVFPTHHWLVPLVVVVSVFLSSLSPSSLSSRLPPIGPKRLVCIFGGAQLRMPAAQCMGCRLQPTCYCVFVRF